MYSEDDVKKLVDDSSNVLYTKNFRGQLQYYSLPPAVLTELLNQAYLKAYSDAFEQAEASEEYRDL